MTEKDIEGVTKEDIAFGRSHPFKTLMLQACGPLVYYLTRTFQDAINLFMIKKAYGNIGSYVVSLASMLRGIIGILSCFMANALTIQISGLIGQKRNEEAEQLIVDSLRISVIISIIMNISFYFGKEPLLRFTGCPEEFIGVCSNYVMCSASFSIFVSMFQFLYSALLGIGKSTLAAFFQFASFFITLGIVDPLMCFAIKTPVWALGLSYFSGNAVCGLILFGMFFSGVFATKPTFSMFIKKPASCLGQTLGKSVPFLISVSSEIFFPLIILNFMTKAATAAGINPNYASQLYTTFTKPYNIISTIGIGLISGFMSSASYAFNIKKYKRVFELIFWALIMPVISVTTLVCIFYIKPEVILGIWIDSSQTLSYAKNVRPALYTLWMKPITNLIVNFVILTGHPVLAMLSPICLAVSMLLSLPAIYYNNKSNPWKLFYSIFISDIFEAGAALFGAIFPLVFIYNELKKAKKEDSTIHSLIAMSSIE